MDLRAAISDFVNRGKELCHRLRSPESSTVTAVDLHVLKAQMHLLNSEIVSLQTRQNVHTKKFESSE